MTPFAELTDLPLRLREPAVRDLAWTLCAPPLLAQPPQQAAAYHGLLAGNQQRSILQASWKRTFKPLCQRRGGEEAQPALAQLLAVALDVQVVRHGAVGNHQVQALNSQVCQ